jgi:amino acid transporter
MTAASTATAGGSSLSREGLVRAIGRWTLVALMINSIVGAGIFGLPARVHAVAGAHALLAYVACAVVIACIALCLAEVASRLTATGGPYLYTLEAFGRQPAFLVGWLMLIGRMTALAIIANVMADYFAYFWPPAAEGAGHTGVMVAALVVLGAINYIGVRPGAGVAAALTVAKLIPMLLFVGIGLFFIDPQRFATPAPDGTAFTQAVLLLVFAFGGFEATVVVAGEMKEPRRDAPFALLIGIGVATVLYVLIQTVCIGTLPDLANSARPLADAASRFAGPAGGAVIAVGAFISTLGTLGGSTLAAPRVLFAMAEHRQMPAWLAGLHPRFHSPHLAIMAIVGGAVLLAVTGTFTYLLGLNVLTRLIQYLLCAMAVLVLRRRHSGTPAPFTIPGAVLVVAITVISSLWLIARSSPRELRDVAIALGIGALAYAGASLMRRRPT